MEDLAGVTSRYNSFLNISPKQNVTDILPKAVSSSSLGSTTVTISQLAANSYSSSNVASTLVFRDVSGNFAANIITGRTTANEVPLTFNSPFLRTTNTISYSGDLPISAHNIVTDTTTGTKIGTATNQKWAFFNSTPIVQPASVGSSTGFSAGATVATFHSDDTYTGNVGSTAYTINGIVAALKNLGLIAS